MLVSTVLVVNLKCIAKGVLNPSGYLSFRNLLLSECLFRPLIVSRLLPINMQPAYQPHQHFMDSPSREPLEIGDTCLHSRNNHLIHLVLALCSHLRPFANVTHRDTHFLVPHLLPNKVFGYLFERFFFLLFAGVEEFHSVVGCCVFSFHIQTLQCDDRLFLVLK